MNQQEAASRIFPLDARGTMEQVECLAPSEKKGAATVLLSLDGSPSALILVREHSNSECSLASTGILPEKCARPLLRFTKKCATACED